MIPRPVMFLVILAAIMLALAALHYAAKLSSGPAWPY